MVCRLSGSRELITTYSTMRWIGLFAFKMFRYVDDHSQVPNTIHIVQLKGWMHRHDRIQPG
jgi:hypothetical protein